MDDSDCSHVDGKKVCNNGTCVECTATKDLACTTGICVIEPITEEQTAFTCDASITPQTAGSCVPCVATKQCTDGRVCVSMTEGETELGNFCLLLQSQATDGACSTARPYIQAEELTPVEDGAPVSVCTLRLTTCQGLDDFSAKDCMTLDEAGDALCGAEGVSDGYCVKFDDARQPNAPYLAAAKLIAKSDTCASLDQTEQVETCANWTPMNHQNSQTRLVHACLAVGMVMAFACTSEPPAVLDAGRDASQDASMDMNVPDAVVECSEEEPCTTRDLSRCLEGKCVACGDSSHCTQFPGTPVCGREDRCVACDSNTNCREPGKSR